MTPPTTPHNTTVKRISTLQGGEDVKAIPPVSVPAPLARCGGRKYGAGHLLVLWCDCGVGWMMVVSAGVDAGPSMVL